MAGVLLAAPACGQLVTPYYVSAGSVTLTQSNFSLGASTLVVTGGRVGVLTASPLQSLDVDGYAIRKIYRAKAYHDVTDADSGQLSTRVLSFTKQGSSGQTSLRVTYTDNFRAVGSPGSCQWEIRVDGSSCSPALLYALYDASSQNPHRVNSVVGYCGGIGAGAHQLQVWIGATPGYSCEGYTGWYTTWLLEVEEVR